MSIPSAMSHGTILIVEDEPESMALARQYLEGVGYQVAACPTGREALRLIRRDPPTLVLLDLSLPDIDGIEVCRQLKYDSATRSIPVVIVTGRGDEADVVLGLGLGADDYVPKPYRLKELVARATAAIRRRADTQIGTPGGRLSWGPLVVDREQHLATLRGKPVHLTPSELRLVYHLMTQPGQVFTRSRLVSLVCDDAPNVTERTVDAHVQAIRRKFGNDRDLILTIHRVGYRLSDPDGEAIRA